MRIVDSYQTSARAPDECGYQRMPTPARRSDWTGAIALLLSLGGCVHGPAAPPWLVVLQPDLTFTAYSPLSRSAEVVRRIPTPLTFRYAQQTLAAGRRFASSRSI